MSEFFTLYVRYWPEWWSELAPGILVTLGVTVCAYGLSLALSVPIALGKMSRIPGIRHACVAYVEVMRGVPPLAILYLIYFGLVPLGIALDAFVAGSLGLALSYAGYNAENLRAGIEAIHKGQREAALAVGMTPVSAFFHIILPQAVRVVLPPFLNAFVRLLKESSICSLISVPELMLHGKDLASQYFLPMHVFLLCGILYLLMAWPMSIFVRWLERRMGRGLRRL